MRNLKFEKYLIRQLHKTKQLTIKDGCLFGFKDEYLTIPDQKWYLKQNLKIHKIHYMNKFDASVIKTLKEYCVRFNTQNRLVYINGICDPETAIEYFLTGWRYTNEWLKLWFEPGITIEKIKE